MKRILTLLSILPLLITVAHSQATVTVPGPPTSQVVLTWVVPAECTATPAPTIPCTFQPYRIPGTGTIAVGTTGATALSVTAVNATTATDTAVTAGTTYSYAVETVQGINSVPSNTITVTIPSVPPAPVLNGATGTASITVKSGTLTATATTTVKDTSTATDTTSTITVKDAISAAKGN